MTGWCSKAVEISNNLTQDLKNMHTPRIIPLAISAIALLTVAGAQAGPLEPPGPPGSTMHTLTEIYQKLVGLEQRLDTIDNRLEGLGYVSQTPASLIANGPQGEYILLNWGGSANVVITSMPSGKVPLGKPFYIEVPRTIANSGGPGGHGTGALGNYVEFRHGASINCAANNRLSYRATPNANDWRGDHAALAEILEFVRVGTNQFRLTRLPEPVTGFTHGDPIYVPGTTSRTGFAWERRADGTTHLTNGTVRVPAHDVGGSEPRFRLDMVWPFRFEQHHGNHRCVQMGISTKETNAYWTDLTVPRNSSTDTAGMRVTVYVSPSAQSQVRTGDVVAVTIMATGNWRQPSDQW